MARFVFKLPDVGEGIAEVEIVKWHVAEGSKIEEDQPLVDIMTDKATVEIGAPVSGIVSGVAGAEGQKLAVGATLAVFDTEREEEPQRDTAPPSVSQHTPLPATPSQNPSHSKALAAPAVRQRAKTLGIDIAEIQGSGPGGRVTHADLDQRLTRKETHAASAVAPPPAGEAIEEVRIFGLRRRIAERMLESKRRVPHFTYVEEVDVQALEDLRQKLNADRARPHLTILPFLIRALVNSLARHPSLNAHYDDASGTLRKFKSVHAGIATQTERGLLVPVIRNAGQFDLWQLSDEISRLSEAARKGKSDRSELQGSTITLTSLGALGGVMATPIINPPEVAIIGTNRITERAVVREGTITARKMMNLSSSFDHRIIDGYEAASFIAAIRKDLENPEELL
jgi:2-oxoisovalerate dehydrogenase E2 component (dihydrolipoyl transacylase)